MKRNGIHSRTYKEIDDLRAKFEKSKDTDKLKMLEEINVYVEELEKLTRV